MTKIWCATLVEKEYTRAQISEEWFDSGIDNCVCKPVEEPFPDVTLEIASKYVPADFFQPGTVFTVSDRLKAVLEEFDVRAEFFPLRILYKGKEFTRRTFYYCHIFDCVDCFDFKRGKYTFETNPGFTHLVSDIHELAIDEKKAAGHDLFRIAKGGEWIKCVSDRVASRIAEERFTGMRLLNPEDWARR